MPEFNAGDIRLAYTINGKNVSGIGFPDKDKGFKVNQVICENGVSASWNESEWSLKLIETNKQDRIKCSIDFITPTMSDYLINLSKKDTSIILQEHEETEQTGTNAQKDYRFIGKNPNNYVCLESNGECNEDELYRIIGVIPTQESENGTYENRVKLIKSINYVGETALKTTDNYTREGVGYIWGENKDWTTSSTNTAILNKEYWDKISDYQKYIDKSKWYLGRNYTTVFYTGERSLTQYQNYPIFEVSNIALMYPSDIIYAVGNTDSLERETCLSKKWHGENSSEVIDCFKNNNWLYQGAYDEWLLFNSYGDDCCSFLESASQELVMSNGGVSRIVGIRPSFYLKSSVKYLTGEGTLDSPYQIIE